MTKNCDGQAKETPEDILDRQYINEENIATVEYSVAFKYRLYSVVAPYLIAAHDVEDAASAFAEALLVDPSRRRKAVASALREFAVAIEANLCRLNTRKELEMSNRKRFTANLFADMGAPTGYMILRLLHTRALDLRIDPFHPPVPAKDGKEPSPPVPKVAYESVTCIRRLLRSHHVSATDNVSISRLLDGLQALGLVSHRQDGEERNSRYIAELTEKGFDLMRSIRHDAFALTLDLERERLQRLRECSPESYAYITGTDSPAPGSGPKRASRRAAASAMVAVMALAFTFTLGAGSGGALAGDRVIPVDGAMAAMAAAHDDPADALSVKASLAQGMDFAAEVEPKAMAVAFQRDGVHRKNMQSVAVWDDAVILPGASENWSALLHRGVWKGDPVSLGHATSLGQGLETMGETVPK